MIWLWIVLFFGACTALLVAYVYFVEIRTTPRPVDEADVEPVAVGARR
jgi:hypothetical protein